MPFEVSSDGQRPLLIRRAQLPTRGLFDLRIADGRIVALAERLSIQTGERIVDAAGNALLPGLHDHHLHLFATAAARASVHCGPHEVNDEQGLRGALMERVTRSEGWIRGTGFHDSVCPGLDRRWLDVACPHHPVRIQHRSGMLWILNSRALELLRIDAGETLPAGAERGNDGKLTGRFYDLDEWLGQRLPRAWPSLRALSAELASFGITSVTDTGARNGRAVWDALCIACERGELLQRVLVMGKEELQEMPRTCGRVSLGPLKIYLREFDLPEYDALVNRIRAAHASGRAVAVHCVTRVELEYTLAALAEAGGFAGDRIEHAAVADDYALRRMAALGLTVVTQPHFIAERGDEYLVDVEPLDIPLLYRGAGFVAAGVAVAAGSDAPYGDIDPWAAMRAAITRKSRDGVAMGAAECLAPAQAIALFGGDAHRPGKGLRQLAVGQPADLCLLDLPWDALCEDLQARHVALTLCDGRIIHASAHGRALLEP